MDQTILVKDKKFKKFISAGEIEEAINTLAAKLNQDIKDENPLFLVILNGAFMFAGDLMKKITVPCNISFVKLASYVGTQSTRQVTELIGLSETINGRSIVILEDIIDTGKTLEVLLEKLKGFEVKKVRIAALLHKPDAFLSNYTIDYIGMKIPNDFIVGYGLDYDGYGRNLPDIYKIV